MTAGRMLLALLRDPMIALKILPAEWTDIVALARRELVLGHLASVLTDADIISSLEPRLQAMLQDGLREAAQSHGLARGEARFIAAALNMLGCPVLVLKGSAYVLAELNASGGRLAGDLDILVPRSYLGAAEIALKEAGFHMLVKNAYDENYYRNWMHELPPFQHIERKSLIDVHHTILPLTGRVQPDAKALVAEAVPLSYGLYRLADADLVLHSAAHLIQDGDLNGGLRNLHDIHRLATEFSQHETFWQELLERAERHQLQRALFYALRASERLFGTHIPALLWAGLRKTAPNAVTRTLMDWAIDQRLAGLSIGQKSLSHQIAGLLLYVRSHWLRMPPLMTLKHLARKAWLRTRSKS